MKDDIRNLKINLLINTIATGILAITVIILELKK